MPWAPDLYIVRVVWDREGHASSWCGPIVGDARTNRFMTFLRKRMRGNGKAFVRVERDLLRTPMWLSSMDCMRDSVDRMLDDVFETTSREIESVL